MSQSSPTILRARPHGARYPWREWFQSSGPLTLRQGQHFHCLVHGFAQSARQAAGRLGYEITLDLGRDTVTLEVTGKRSPA